MALLLVTILIYLNHFVFVYSDKRELIGNFFNFLFMKFLFLFQHIF